MHSQRILELMGRGRGGEYLKCAIPEDKISVYVSLNAPLVVPTLYSLLFLSQLLKGSAGYELMS